MSSSADEADRARLFGQRARAGLAGVGLPDRGRGLPARRSTSATARSGRCSATSTPADVDAIVISHLHADHCIDLTALRRRPALRRRRVPRARAGRAHPDRRRARHPRPPRGRVRPAGPQARPARDLQLRHPDGQRARAVPDVLRADEPPDADERGADRVRATARWSTPPTPASAPSWSTLADGRRRAAVRGVGRAGRGAQVPDLHLTGRQAGEHAERGRRRAADRHPRAAVELARRSRPTRPPPRSTASVEIARPGARVLDLSAVTRAGS